MGRLDTMIGNLTDAGMRRFRSRVQFMLVGRTQGAFADQKLRPTESGWDERFVPNLAGILSDLAKGPNVKSRRFDPRPAGIDTGSLRNSVQGQWMGNTFEYGSKLSYASRFQRGEPHTFQFTPTLKDNLKAWYRREKKLWQKGGPMAGYGWLFRIEQLTITPRPRKFVAFTEQDRKDVGTVFKQEMLRERGT